MAGNCVRCHPKVTRNLVGRSETDAEDLGSKPVRCPFDDTDGFVPVLFEYLHGEVCGNAVPLKKEHHPLDGSLFGPRALNHLNSLARYAFHFNQTLDIALDDVQSLLAEMVHNALGSYRANTFDQTRAKILLDARDRRRACDFVFNCLELLSKLRMRGPEPLQAHTLTGRDD
jgi:hypothetical protein